MEKNPWLVNSHKDFLWYCCPECDMKSKEYDRFYNHAIYSHDLARKTLMKTPPKGQTITKLSFPADKTKPAPVGQSVILSARDEPRRNVQVPTVVSSVTPVTPKVMPKLIPRASVTKNVTPTVAPIATTSVTPITASSLTSNATSIASSSVTSAVTPSVTPVIPTVVTQNVAQNATHSVTQNVTPAVMPSVKAIAPNMVSSVTPSVTSTVTPNVTPVVVPTVTAMKLPGIPGLIPLNVLTPSNGTFPTIVKQIQSPQIKIDDVQVKAEFQENVQNGKTSNHQAFENAITNAIVNQEMEVKKESLSENEDEFMSCHDNEEEEEAVTDDACSVTSSDFECDECKLKCDMNETGDFECSKCDRVENETNENSQDLTLTYSDTESDEFFDEFLAEEKDFQDTEAGAAPTQVGANNVKTSSRKRQKPQRFRLDHDYSNEDEEIEVQPKKEPKTAEPKLGSKPYRTQNRKSPNIAHWLLELLETKSPAVSWMDNPGEFKVTNTTLLAKLWGERKGNTAMTYNNVA